MNKQHMPFKYDDGGRKAAGFKGSAGDCVARAIAIAAEMPYEEVYERLASGAGKERKSRGRSARNGIHTKRKWFKEFMNALGFEWIPCMGIGTGCKVHLVDGELPYGRLVAVVSGHYTAVINRVVRDTYDPQRSSFRFDPNGPDIYGGNKGYISERCVYGYWHLAAASEVAELGRMVSE